MNTLLFLYFALKAIINSHTHTTKGNCGEALEVKVSSIWNKAFTVLSGVAILSEKWLHLFQMSPSRAQKMCFGRLINQILFFHFLRRIMGISTILWRIWGNGKTPRVGQEGETFEQLSCCSILCMPFNECNKGCPITVDDEHFIK